MIEIFADITCPFTHVGLVRLLERRARLGRAETLHVKAWPLELVNGERLTGPGIAGKVDELRRRVAPDLFRGFDPAGFPATSLPALALATAASRTGAHAGELVSLELRRALFEDGLDVSRVDVLDAIARKHGVQGPWDAGAVLLEWGEGQRRGVEGSPTYFVDGERFFCPALRIEHADNRVDVSVDQARFDEFVRRAFPPADPVAIGGPSPLGGTCADP